MTRAARYASRAVQGILGAMVGAWALSSLWLPFGGDQGCFAYVGDTIVRGGMPYRDAWDFKGPLTYCIYALLEAMFGRQMWGVRAVDLVLLTGAGWSIVTMLSRHMPRGGAVVAALTAVLLFASFGSWYTAQPDGWTALAMCIIVAMFWRREQPSIQSMMLAGFVIGCLTLFKPPNALYFAVLICAAWAPQLDAWPRVSQRLGAAAAAFALPIVAMVAWFAARGALADLIDVHLRFNMERIATDPHLRYSIGQTIAITLGIFTGVPVVMLALPLAVLGAAALVRERPRDAAMLLAWFGVALFIVVWQKKFLLQNYTWETFYLPLALLTAIGASRLWDMAPSLPPIRWAVVVLVLLVVKTISREPLRQVAWWLRYMKGSMGLDDFRAGFDRNVPELGGRDAADVGFSVDRNVKLARYFADHTAPSEAVLVWGDAMSNYLGNRPAITPITATDAFTVWGSEVRRKRYRTDLLARMSQNDATYFCVPSIDLADSAESGEGGNIPARFPELAQTLAEHYERVGTLDDVVMFRHRR